MVEKYGVFLARMQPVHNAHLYMVNKALDECDKVLIVLGSENKVEMLRNPYDITIREKMLRECFSDTQNDGMLHSVTSNIFSRYYIVQPWECQRKSKSRFCNGLILRGD